MASRSDGRGGFDELREWRQAEAALAEIRRYSLPPSPANYSLFHAACSGTRPHLAERIAAAAQAENGIAQADVTRIYFEAFAEQNPPALADVGERLAGEIAATQQAVGMHRAATHAYSNQLKTTVSGLGLSPDARDLAEAFLRLVDQSRNMEVKNGDLQAALERAQVEIDGLRKEIEEARYASLTDALTGLANRRALDERLAALCAADAPFSILVVDIDHFKSFNDTHGHPLGDQVLKMIAAALRACVRADDLVARHGGEEFCVLMPAASAFVAETAAEHVREAIARRPLVKRGGQVAVGPLTVSIGVADRLSADTPETLYRRADEALYQAKNQGRNRVVVARDDNVERRKA